jgi:7,8-dihydropterin-6-yl-methyl-4-(beta-D-ribofuranosyl)aminobenzene 5'-phosphate synthase
MDSLTPVDKLEIQVLVDNATDNLSSVPGFVETELAYLERHGMTELTGDCLCCACHGLSLLIVASRGASRHAVLFDSGPEEYAFERNSRRLGVNLGQVESVVLSHGHWDHAGGMLKALELIGAGNGGREVPYYAHPGMFASRARRLANGSFLPTKDVPKPPALAAHGARVLSLTESATFLDEMFFVSGEIARVTPFEKGLPAHYQKSADGQWEPDPWLRDERFLAVQVKDKGLVIFTACSHAGVINVLSHARQCFPAVPLYAVAGGLHLSGPNESIIAQTVAALAPFELSVIATGHCTGWRATVALANAFSDATLVPLAVGKRYSF